MKKYNPLFPDVFYDSEFSVPNIIVIRDDAERRDIDVCEGAIGWLSKGSGMEILYLYDEEVPSCGLTFVPSADCNAIYYVDSHDRKRFIRTDCIFNRAHEEKIAELKHIAYCLGAKMCTIEINESDVERTVVKKKASVGVGGRIHGVKASTSESVEQNASTHNTNQRSGKVTITFEGSSAPQMPTLKWFANDGNITKLIDIRLNGNNSIKSEELRLSGASSATMSQKTACAIDNALGPMKAKGSSTMESQAVRESHSTFLFSIEF